MISEPYDINFNYQVSLTGNDGFSLMDRFSFLQSDGSNYTGIMSKFDIIKIIFGEIGLGFTEYRIALATTFTGYSGLTASTILHESYIDCANFYDEDKKPMSLREVMESILAPYGAYIRAENTNIYIEDIHTLASGGSTSYKRFNFGTFAYSGIIAIPNVKTISSIGYKGTGTQIEMSGGVNRQVVTYSPYPLKTILDESLVGLEEFTGIPPTFSTKDGYNYKTLTVNKYWEIDAAKLLNLNPTTFEESFYLSQNDENIYLRFPRYGGLNGIVASYKIMPYVNLSIPEYGNPDDLYRLLNLNIKCEILTKSKQQQTHLF